MSTPWHLLLALAALAAVYVLLPVAALTFSAYRGRRTLHCPEVRKVACVGVDARRAALASLFGRRRLRVQDCSLWPGTGECTQGCLRALPRSRRSPRRRLRVERRSGLGLREVQARSLTVYLLPGGKG